MVQQEGECVSGHYGTCLIAVGFPSVASGVAKSKDGDSWCFETIGQLPGWCKDGLLLLIFLNWRDPKEDQKQDKEQYIEEGVYGASRGERHDRPLLTPWINASYVNTEQFTQYNSFPENNIWLHTMAITQTRCCEILERQEKVNDYWYIICYSNDLKIEC